jgi:hypothetical protein
VSTYYETTTRADGRTARVAEWRRKLRTNCELLVHSRGSVIRALGLTWCVGEDPDDVEAITRLARGLADEYGLATTVEPRGTCLTVRFRLEGKARDGKREWIDG